MIAALEDIPDEVRRLDAAGLYRARQWNLAQITEHLALTMDFTTGALRPDKPTPPRMSRLGQFFARRVVFFTGRLPLGVPTFDFVVPPADVELSGALEHLQHALYALRRVHGPMPAHALLGRMSKRQWLKFHLIHARHHLGQVTNAAKSKQPRPGPCFSVFA